MRKSRTKKQPITTSTIHVDSSCAAEVSSFETRQDYNEYSQATEYETAYAGLLPLLNQLDQRLSAAVEAADRVFAARAAGDLYRGLAITPADVAAAFDRIPGQPFLKICVQLPMLSELTDSLSLRRLLWLQRIYGLSELDLGVILIGLAPEIDLRYERLYAYLHDDVSRRRPSVDLALNVLCSSATEKLAQRQRFAPSAPLLRHQLIEFQLNLQNSATSSLAQHYRLDEQIVRLLLLEDSLDSRLADCCEIQYAEDRLKKHVPLAQAMQDRLTAFAEQRPSSGLRLYFQGPSECGQEAAIAQLATKLGLRILTVDSRRIAHKPNALQILVREAWFNGALLHIRDLTALDENSFGNPVLVLWQALKNMPTDCVIEGESCWGPAADKPLGVVTVNFAYPSAEQRKHWWHHCLTEHGATLGEEDQAELAQRYRMTFAQIADAAATGAFIIQADWESQALTDEVREKRSAQTIYAAARAQCGHDLSTLANKIQPRATWDDLVLPEDETQQLREICNRFKYRDKVINEWGFAQKLSYGLGITALFSGGSGTGKTMAAEVIASALGLDLYKIDLAQVVSKYIGETEKNLNKVFTAAENANAILFFDEADALFGKRSEVKDSHDRYANLEISYLLQKMEQYEGIAIMATNLADNLDQAFTRRLAFSIHFPFPDEVSRLRIWERAWPHAVLVSAAVDRSLLARELKVAGGNIKNVALTTAFNAAGNGGVVDMTHMVDAVRRELEKNGRSSTSADSLFKVVRKASIHEVGKKGQNG